MFSGPTDVVRSVHYRLHALRVSLAAAMVAGCTADLNVRTASPEERLDALTATDRRVGPIYDRLARANVHLCPDTAPSAGWTLHAAAQYSPALRKFAEVRYGLRGDLPGVLDVSPGSPAAQAGLASGDLILALDGTQLLDGGVPTAARYQGLARNLTRLEGGLSSGRARLTIQRGLQTFEAEIEPRLSCSYPIQVDPANTLYAKADGQRVYISTAMAAQAASDDELAMILAHELAHNILQHHRNSAVLKLLPWRSGAAEREADRLGLYLVARAGFRSENAIEFWRHYGEANWEARQLQWGYPSAPERYRTLMTVRDEIDRLRARGLPLLPSDARLATHE